MVKATRHKPEGRGINTIRDTLVHSWDRTLKEWSYEVGCATVSINNNFEHLMMMMMTILVEVCSVV